MALESAITRTADGTEAGEPDVRRLSRESCHGKNIETTHGTSIQDHHIGVPVTVNSAFQIRRPSNVIADGLRGMILRGDFDDRMRLSPEPEFARQLGVSRYHLREALRLLEQDGLVKVRSGRNGGIFLIVPGYDILARAFTGILSRKGTTLADLLTARLVIEPNAAELAATNATDEELSEIAAIVDNEAEAGEYRGDLNSLFHVRVTEGSHNDTLLLMMRSIESMVHDLDLMMMKLPAWDPIDSSHRAHRAILRALCSRDGAKAKDYVCRHLLGFDALLKTHGLDPAQTKISEISAVSPVTMLSRHE